MKKSLLGIAALAGLMLATSCSNEDFKAPAGKAGTISFNVGIEQSLGTRAISDGTQATSLVYQVYDSNGTTPVGEQGTADLVSGSATVDVTLPAGNYMIAFWAQNSECDVYDTADLAAVKVNTSELMNNDEAMDAFFAVADFTVDGNGSQTVQLRRPFAQINVAFADEVSYKTSAVKIDGTIYNTLNLVTGEVSGGQETTLEYAENEVPDEILTLTLNGEQKEFNGYVSMTYFLVDAKENVDVTLSLDGNEFATFENIPVQRNYRTNILCDVPNGTFTFTVVVDPEYAQPDYNEFENQDEVTLSEVKATYNEEENTIEFFAKYEPADATVNKAGFYLIPANAAETMNYFSRAEEAKPIWVEGEASNGDLTATLENADQYAGQSFTIQAVVNNSESATDGEGNEEVPSITIPTEPSVTYPETMYIMGNINGTNWGSSIAMTTTAPGKYSIESITMNNATGQEASFFGFASVKIEDNNWNDPDGVNMNRWVAAEEDAPAIVGSANSMYVNDNANDGNSWQVAGAIYSVSVDLTTTPATFTLTKIDDLPAAPTPDTADTIYVVGNGTDMTWNLPGQEYTKEDGVFTLNLKGVSKFKFSINNSSDWDGEGEYNAGAYIASPAFGDSVYPSGETASLINNGEDLELPWQGDYTITINLNEMKITAVASSARPLTGSPLYIRGASFGWDGGDCKLVNQLDCTSYNSDGTGTWETDNITIPASSEFKVADNSWGSYNFGNGGSTINIGTSPVTTTFSYNSDNAKLSASFTGSIKVVVTKPGANYSASVTFTPATVQ